MSKSSLTRKDDQSISFIAGIYYFLERDPKSAWNRINNVDQNWIDLMCDTLNLWCLDNNNLIRNIILDSNNPVEKIPS